MPGVVVPCTGGTQQAADRPDGRCACWRKSDTEWIRPVCEGSGRNMVFSELVPISGGLVEVDSLHKLFTLSTFRTPPYLKLEAPDFLPCRHVVAAASTLARAACHEVYRNARCLTIPVNAGTIDQA